MEDFIKEFIGKFLRDNAADMAGLSKDLVDAGISTGISEVIPDKYMTPSLNNLRMKYSAEALKVAADEKERMDRIKERVKEELIGSLWKGMSTAIIGVVL